MITEQVEKHEWKDLSPDAPIRQGDILVTRHHKSRVVEQMVVVITADCDIDKKKHGPQIACLNVQFHDEYIRTSWSQAMLAAAKRNALSQAGSKLRSVFANSGRNPEMLSDQAIEDWLIRDEIQAIANQLDVPESDLRSFDRSLRCCQTALRKAKELDGVTPFDRLRSFYAELNGKTLDESRVDLLKKALDATLPSDTFLLPGFPTDQKRPALILLREVIGVPSDMVTTRQSEVSTERPFLRVGRLRSTFKFALSQSFGALYSKIGLPAAYEQRRKTALSGTLSYEWK